MQSTAAWAHFFAGRYAEALIWAETALREKPDYFLAKCVAVASRALTGQLSEGEKAVAALRQLMPGFRISTIKDLLPIQRSEDFARLAEGLRRAGLPD
jgi:hypothetical protein